MEMRAARPGPCARRDPTICRAQFGEIDRVAAQFGAADARKAQHVVNQLAHLLGGFADALQVMPRFFGERIVKILQQNAAEAIQRAQGSAQVVRNRVGERLQLAVAGLQFQCARAQLVFHAAALGNIQRGSHHRNHLSIRPELRARVLQGKRILVELVFGLHRLTGLEHLPNAAFGKFHQAGLIGQHFTDGFANQLLRLEIRQVTDAVGIQIAPSRS